MGGRRVTGLSVEPVFPSSVEARRWIGSTVNRPVESLSESNAGPSASLARPFQVPVASMLVGAVAGDFVYRSHHLARRCLMDHVAGFRNSVKRALRNIGMQAGRLLVDVDQPVVFARVAPSPSGTSQTWLVPTWVRRSSSS